MLKAQFQSIKRFAQKEVITVTETTEAVANCEMPVLKLNVNNAVVTISKRFSNSQIRVEVKANNGESIITISRDTQKEVIKFLQSETFKNVVNEFYTNTMTAEDEMYEAVAKFNKYEITGEECLTIIHDCINKATTKEERENIKEYAVLFSNRIMNGQIKDKEVVAEETAPTTALTEWAGEYSAEAVIYTAHNNELGVKLEVVKDTEYNEVTATFTVNGEVKHEVFYDKPVRLETVKANLERIYNDYVQALEESVGTSTDSEAGAKYTDADSLLNRIVAINDFPKVSPIISTEELSECMNVLLDSDIATVKKALRSLVDARSEARKNRNADEYDYFMNLASKLSCVIETMQLNGTWTRMRMGK